MKTVVINSQKGGSGKTTLAAHLAVTAERDGAGPVVLIDTDPQQTLATWWNIREATTPQLAPVSIRELPEKLRALRKAGFTYCFIDTPPALSDQNRQVLRIADLALIPARPSPNDLWTLGATVDLVKECGAPFVFILSQAKSNARITSQTVAALSAHGQVLPAFIGDRVSYADCMTDGRTAIELNPEGPAAREITQLWKQVCSRLADLASLSDKANISENAKKFLREKVYV